VSDEALPFRGEEAEPTPEERAAVELAWRKGEPLPPPWIVFELPAGPTDAGHIIPPGKFVMLKSPKLWAEDFADVMKRDPSTKVPTLGGEPTA
jgi:hypothetical protein